MRALAQKARSERIGVVPAPPASVPVDEDDMRVEYEHEKDNPRERERDRSFMKESREEKGERTPSRSWPACPTISIEQHCSV